jgi:2'-5' RNA ligase
MESEKTLCVMGLFDPVATNAFLELRRLLNQNGFEMDDQPPHLTFGIYDGIDLDAFTGWVSSVAARQLQVRLAFHHLGLFQSGTVFAEPCANENLLALHRQLHSKYDQACVASNCLYSLKYKSWVPHVTLFTAPQTELCCAMPLLLNRFSPIEATITQLVITEFPPMKIVETFPLKEGD